MSIIEGEKELDYAAARAKQTIAELTAKGTSTSEAIALAMTPALYAGVAVDHLGAKYATLAADVVVLPDGHLKFPHLWPLKFLHPSGRTGMNY